MAVTQPQSLGDFLKWNPLPPKEILGKGLLHEGGKAILYGRYKTYKSMLVLWISYRLALGLPVFDIDVPAEGTSVLYLQLEISHNLLHRRAVPMWRNIRGTYSNGVEPALRKPVWIWSERFIKLDTPQGAGQLGYELDRLKPDLLIVDPVYKAMSSHTSDPQGVINFQDNLDVLAQEHGHATLLVAHPRKPPPGSDTETGKFGSDDLSGLSIWSNWADSVIKVKPRGGDKNLIVLGFDVTRHSEEEVDDIDVSFDRDTLQFRDVTVRPV